MALSAVTVVFADKAHSRAPTNATSGISIRLVAAPSSNHKRADITASGTKQRKDPPRRRTNYTIPLIGFILSLLILVAGERDRLLRRGK